MHLRLITRRTLFMGGVDVRRARRLVRLLPRYANDLRTFRRATRRAGDAALPLGVIFPIVTDRVASAGDTDGPYFTQDLWAARKIHAAAPARHVDIGSRIDGFIGHLLVFREVEVIDIRPLSSAVEGLTFRQEDATSLSSIPDRSIESLSSLHAVEHFGLGRYGDPLDPLACFTAMAALARVLAPGGTLYFSVPVGHERVEFNAHRILDPHRVIRSFGDLDLVTFDLIDDAGTLHLDADPDHAATQNEATGLFVFTRPRA